MVKKVTAVATTFKGHIRRISHGFIQCLNAVLIVSVQAMAVVSIGLSLLAISKQLYLVQNQAMWSMAVVIAFGISVLNVILTIFMLILARVTKYSFPRIRKHKEGVYLYMRVEMLAIVALMLLANAAFRLYTGGHGITTWSGDHWWVVAIQTTWWTSGFAVLAIASQLLTWGVDKGKGNPGLI